MPLAFIFSAPAMLTIGMVYALLTAAMPRSGGDYVWASRILHPAIGFGVNFFVTFILLSSAGLNSLLMATWFLPPVFHILGLDGAAAFSADTTGYGAVLVGTLVTLLLLGVFLLGLRRVRQIMVALETLRERTLADDRWYGIIQQQEITSGFIERVTSGLDYAS